VGSEVKGRLVGSVSPIVRYPGAGKWWITVERDEVIFYQKWIRKGPWESNFSLHDKALKGFYGITPASRLFDVIQRAHSKKWGPERGSYGIFNNSGISLLSYSPDSINFESGVSLLRCSLADELAKVIGCAGGELRYQATTQMHFKFHYSRVNMGKARKDNADFTLPIFWLLIQRHVRKIDRFPPLLPGCRRTGNAQLF
jgi:hypothetical protein